MAPSAEVENLLERLAQVSENSAYRASEVKYLDPRTLALVVVGAAICLDAPAKAFQALVGSALQAGATQDDVLWAMLAVAPAAARPPIRCRRRPG